MTTEKIYYDEIVATSATPAPAAAVHIVTDVDMFEADIPSPLFHNFANNTHPGGPCSEFSPDGKFLWHDDRSKTQEDQVVVRFKEWIRFPHDMYPICTRKRIACLIHHGEPPILTLPAPYRPDLEKPAVRQDVVRRMHLALAVASKLEKNLVTGLWGCGAFGANPITMAELWREALATAPALPRHVYFCIRIDRFSEKWGLSAFEAFRSLGLQT